MMETIFLFPIILDKIIVHYCALTILVEANISDPILVCWNLRRLREPPPEPTLPDSDAARLFTYKQCFQPRTDSPGRNHHHRQPINDPIPSTTPTDGLSTTPRFSLTTLILSSTTPILSSMTPYFHRQHPYFHRQHPYFHRRPSYFHRRAPYYGGGP